MIYYKEVTSLKQVNLLDLVLLKFQLRVATIVDVKNAQESFANAGYLLVNMSFAAKAAEIERKRLTYTLTP